MKVSDVFVKSLENEGVAYIFGVPGEENEDLLFSLDQSTIQFVPCRHEQGAAFIANVLGRLTGKAGVCLSTLGPGATNLVTGVADANMDKAPMVVITAQGSLDRLHHESHQQLDIVNLFRPITKWNTAVSAAKTVPEVVRKAFKLAQTEKPGATHIELAEDMAAMDVDEQDIGQLPTQRPVQPDPSTKAIKQVINYLSAARRPLILVGNGAIRASASEKITRLAATHHVPVVSTFMGKGVISDRAAQSLFSIGMGIRDYVMEAFDQTDLIMTIGYDIAEYPPQAWDPSGEKVIIHIDSEPAEVYSHYTPHTEVVGDIAVAIDRVYEGIEQQGLQFDQQWYQPIRERILTEINSYRLETDDFTIPGVLQILRDEMADDSLIISDVGSHKLWIARNFPTYLPNTCLISNGLASMGIALPGGLAAALLDPSRQIVAAMGDGGFLMNVQELETATRLGVGFTIIIFNDNDYGLISWKQRQSRGRSVSTQINNPDFVALAESFGIVGYRPSSLNELREQLHESLHCGEMRLMEIPINPTVNDQLVDKLETYWSKKGEL